MCSRGCLRVLGVGALVGWWDSVAASAAPLSLAVLWWGGLLVFTPWCGRAGVGVVGVCATSMGRDMVVPPHAAWRWAAFGQSRGAERERRGVCEGAPLRVLTRARARAERWERSGSRVGRTVVAWAGVVGAGALGGNTRWWRQVPKAEGKQN